ncbi:MAG TPA: hypothetical protein VM345_13000 [Acidimicrobiales bacterium]|nr:hypothetical protein [Acidimicrobiales bacterium]
MDPAVATFLEQRAGFVASANGPDADEAMLARAAYEVLLPHVAISRSPITGTVFAPTLDVGDLDGPWWDARDPVRGDTTHPAEVVSFTGAMRLASEVTYAPFLAVPGPEIPFVHPGVLATEGVIAVISTVEIGSHHGYPIVYFGGGNGDVPIRLNEWGSNSFRYAGAEGEDFPFEDDWDFDLEPWVSNHKLRWIDPGDGELVVRSGSPCPYVGLEGARGIARVQNGKVWRPDDID